MKEGVYMIKKGKIGVKAAPYMFLLPTLVVFAVFMIYPVISSLILSFNEFNAGEYTFVGLKNFSRLFGDRVFLQALSNTLFYTVIQLPIMVIISLILGNFLNLKSIKFKGFYRLAFFLPVVVSMVAYSIIFKLLLNTDSGIFNQILNTFGFKSVDWLNGEWTSKFSIILGMTWRWTGYNTVIILAGLQSISEDIYEAADIDGANAVQKFLKVTIPLLKPVIIFVVITSTIGTLQLFDESFVLTKGGPDNATISISHYLYNTGFANLNFGYAAAMSYVLVLIIAVISLIQFKLTAQKDSNNRKFVLKSRKRRGA